MGAVPLFHCQADFDRTNVGFVWLEPAEDVEDDCRPDSGSARRLCQSGKRLHWQYSAVQVVLMDEADDAWLTAGRDPLFPDCPLMALSPHADARGVGIRQRRAAESLQTGLQIPRGRYCAGVRVDVAVTVEEDDAQRWWDGDRSRQQPCNGSTAWLSTLTRPLQTTVEYPNTPWLWLFLCAHCPSQQRARPPITHSVCGCSVSSSAP